MDISNIKGTVIPEYIRGNYGEVIANQPKTIKFFYNKKSVGYRYDMQNRLFIIHHSLVSDDKGKRIRVCWQGKGRIKLLLANQAEHIHFPENEGCAASVIFIIETEVGTLKYKIDGLDDDLVSA